MPSDRPGHDALAALDAVLAKKPHKDDQGLSAATRCLTALRDALIGRRRGGSAAPEESARLTRLNAVISLVLAGHFPLGSAPWEELGKARAWLADIVAEVEP